MIKEITHIRESDYGLFRKKAEEIGLSRYLSPVAVWALSFGCAVG